MTKRKPYSLILASGGIDSTACIKFYKNIHFEVEVLFIDYGQMSRKQEYESLLSIASYYKVKLIKLTVSNSNKKFNGGEVIGRNAFLYFTALMNFSKETGVIATGIHSGTNYYDCSNKFINQLEAVFYDYSKGSISIGVPFINFNKREIWDYCDIQKVPVYLTYSCELGRAQPCGLCDTCKDLEALYAGKK